MSRRAGVTSAGAVGAVLVGGASRRMGQPKALLDVAGIPMAQRVASALSTAGCVDVVAVGPSELCAGLPHVDDLYPGQGPLGAILTALRVANGRQVLVVATDLPWIDGSSLASLLGPAANLTDIADVVAARTTRVEPLCAVWLPSSTEQLQSVFDGGERAVHRAMTVLRVFEVDLPAAVLINVNTPDDLHLRAQ